MTQGGPLAAPHIDHCIVVAHCVGAGFYPAQSTYVYRAGGAEPLPYARLMYSTAQIGSRIIKGRTGGQNCVGRDAFHRAAVKRFVFYRQ